MARGLPAAHDKAFLALRKAAPAGITLYRGVELMLDRPVTPDLREKPGLTLGGTRYILVEFTRLVSVPAVSSGLHQIVQLGLIPVLAHPERYRACTPYAVRQWKALGALMQVDATTLLTGRGRGQRARDLLAHGLADIMAADNHGDDRMIGTAYRFLAEAGGTGQADLLGRKNPGAIIEGGELEPVPPFTLKTGLLDKLKQLMGNEE
jgi:protein-tyrosine phosphatase